MTIGIALLGSTGSIGTQTLDVVRHLPGQYSLVSVAARNRTELLEQQVREFDPQLVVAKAGTVFDGYTVLPTPAGLIEAATHPDVDIVVAATSGHDAIPAIAAAIEAGKTIALANKETIVCAGELIMPLARRHGAKIRPVDSEHSAIWQSLRAGQHDEIRRLILTTSGGPFRTLSASELDRVTVEQALRHPNWAMGSKLTIDSSTMMNKGLEVIEAHWLFEVEYDAIDVIVHPTQIIHSMVEFIDNSTIAQLSPPDMRLPIQYALTYPHRVPGPCRPLDLKTLTELTFELPDTDRFPALGIAYEAGRRGGTYPTVLSAADEVAVEAFSQGRITWPGITRLIESVLDRHESTTDLTFESIAEADRWAHAEATKVLRAIAG
jgi:1-deoxy-D-xylulose-5-phosphate reductoisomerase